MPAPPVNIFTQHCIPEDALARLKELIPECGPVLHTAGQWSQITGKWKRGWMKSALTLKVTHSPEYYAGDGWPNQLRGMANYVGRFPGSEKRSDLTGYIMGLSFALSFVAESDIVENDPRLEVVFEMARFLDGVVFLPTCLLDAFGRVIVSADGQVDPNAKLPEHTPRVIESADASEYTEEEEEAISSPDPEQVLARFALLIALVERGFLEEGSIKKGEKERLRIMAVLKDSESWNEAEDWEAQVLEAPVGTLSPKLRWKLPWLSEGAAILGWALRQIELPAYDEQVEVESLYRTRDAIKSASIGLDLRPPEEIEKLSNQMLAIHWRLRQFSVKRESMDFAEYAPRSWWGELDLGLARLINNDLEVNGCTIAESTEESWRCASGIMEERRTAILWLLGAAGKYSEVDTST